MDTEGHDCCGNGEPGYPVDTAVDTDQLIDKDPQKRHDCCGNGGPGYPVDTAFDADQLIDKDAQKGHDCCGNGGPGYPVDTTVDTDQLIDKDAQPVSLPQASHGKRCLLLSFFFILPCVILACVIGNTNSSSQILNYPLHSLPPQTQGYDVFINHRGMDTKKKIASLLFHNLKNKGLEVFLDKYSIKVGYDIPESIEQAIHEASVHIAILSVNYAGSEYCLKELCLMVKTGVPIIPVFWEIETHEVDMDNKDGMYAQALQRHKCAGKINTRTVEKWEVEEWEEALRRVSNIKGIEFSEGDDMGERLEEIAGSVFDLINKKSKKRSLFHARFERRK